MDEVVLYAPEVESVAVVACSPPSWMIQLALLEKRVPHRLQWLDFRSGDHRTPEMLARNPRGTVPVLSHGGRTVYETFAILGYLERAFPDRPLLPDDLDGAARELTLWHTADGLKAAGMAWFSWLMRTPPEQRTDGRLQARFDEELAFWNGRLDADRVERPQLADLAVFAYAATGVWIERSTAAHPAGTVAERHPALGRFLRAMCERHSVTASWPWTWAEGGLSPGG